MKAVLLALLVLPAGALAQDNHSPREKAAMDRLQIEMTVCLAYYSTAKDCLGANDPSAKQYAGMVDQLTGRSYSIGKSIGMTSDTMLARLKAVMDEQGAASGNSCQSVDILNQRHAARCKLVTENPNVVLNEFLKQ